MDRLPLETLQEIFDLASTDDGRTGCALSQVSSRVRTAARKSRFRSVVIVAQPSSLDAFLDVYTRECEPPHGDKACVRDLRLTVPDDVHLRMSPSSLVSSLNDLFRLIAQDVRSLVIDTPAGSGPAALPMMFYPFPAMRRVTFVGLAGLCSLLPREDLTADVRSDSPRLASLSPRHHSHPLFPATTHVRVIIPPSGSSAALDLYALAHHTPRATHLHVANMDPSAPSFEFLTALAKTLEPLPAVSDTGLVAEERAWPNIRNIILQPSPPPASQRRDERGWRGDPGPKERYTDLWRVLRRVESAARGDRLWDSPETMVTEVRRGPKTRVGFVEGREGIWEEWCKMARARDNSQEGSWESSWQTESGAMRDEKMGQAVGLRSGWAHTTVLLPI
ncbi:hypothetical protein C8Q80DRAFT_1149671 [Daedaleopsis nitida]|nr:hypothetical protein C8Q80DRAFT_1149671 [Daedaleopsis nitida]